MAAARALCSTAFPPALVRRWHVRRYRRVAPLEGAHGITGGALAALEHIDRCACHAHVQLGLCTLARHRLVVAVHLDVVVDADPRYLPFGLLVPFWHAY